MGTCRIRFKKLLKVRFKVRLESTYRIAPVLAFGETPKGILEVPERCNILGYVSSSFHCGVIFGVNGFVCFCYIPTFSHAVMHVYRYFFDVYLSPWGAVPFHFKVRKADKQTAR